MTTKSSSIPFSTFKEEQLPMNHPEPVYHLHEGDRDAVNVSISVTLAKMVEMGETEQEHSISLQCTG